MLWSVISPLPGHHALRHRPAMEENALVLFVVVIVVPIQASARAAGGLLQGIHHHRAAGIQLASRRQTAIVQLAEQHAGRDAEFLLKFQPAADRNGAQSHFRDHLIDHHRQTDEILQSRGRHALPRGVALQAGGLGLELRLAGLQFPHSGKDLGQIGGFHGDAVALQGQFIDADGLEGRGSRTQRTDHQRLHAADNAAEPGEIVDVRRELPILGMDHVGLPHGERHVVLAKDVHDRQLAAERIAPLAGRHLVQTIGIGLNENGHPCAAQGRHGAVLVAEVGQRQDHAVDLVAVRLDELRELGAFGGRFDGAVTRGSRVHHQGPMSQPLEAFRPTRSWPSQSARRERNRGSPTTRQRSKALFP